MAAFPQTNKTWAILARARKGNYAVGSYHCYDTYGLRAIIRAAERRKSPAIIQLFPWVMRIDKSHFMHDVVAAAHAARVPIAVHLDLCFDSRDIDLALTLPFDSIMIEGSTLEEDENTEFCADIVKRAEAAGISVEIEMGRSEGGQNRLPQVDVNAASIGPAEAARLLTKTRTHFLAQSFRKAHFGFPDDNPNWQWRFDHLREIRRALPPHTPLALHGIGPRSDYLFQEAIDCDVNKINVNRNFTDEYTKFNLEFGGRMESRALNELGVEVYTKCIECMMDVFGSSGRA